MENGDIVTACSDGVARIWTVHQDKIAEAFELEAYASLLSEYKGSRYLPLSLQKACCFASGFEIYDYSEQQPWLDVYIDFSFLIMKLFYF